MVLPAKPVVCIVTPGTSSANNGNWRTAARWADMLRDRFRVIVQTRWDGEPADALVALHARRSAESVARFHAQRPQRPMAVVLTGTDLYRDLPASREAAASLDLADRIVVLQEDALERLEPRWRAKCGVIFQSASPLASRPKPAGRLHCVAIGHLREEKDPLTLLEAMRRIPAELPIRLRHIGGALDPALEKAVRAFEREDRRYHYSGAVAHGLARAALQSAHLLVHPSIVEGGANVIVEAVTAGTPVVASRISGNVGMLGRIYPGYFEPRDGAGLAALLVRALRDAAFLEELRGACEARRPRFLPEAESAALHALVAALLG